ncbi:MAG: transglutaminase family protein [Acidobacteria bacterium]|nr:transglutaminase family protein [Bryobacteraceae bacterium CoA2 C42]
MAIRVSLHHKTIYHYDRLVTLSPQVVRLRPAPHSRTPIHSYALNVSPGKHFLNWQQDPQGNYLARLVFPDPTDHFSVEVALTADMSVLNPFDFFLEPEAEQFPFSYDATLGRELRPFLETQPLTPLLQNFLAGIPRTPKQTTSFLFDLNAQLQHLVRYCIRMEPGVQTPEETLAKASGSCRDSAWLLVEALRHLGLAARFVSGYLIQLKADENSLDGPSGPEADFTDLHAWTEVFLPGAGWVGLDPTSGLFAGEGHIPLAATPDPTSAAPVTGLVSPCQVEFEHHMSVTRIHEDPRVTKPYTDEQWAAIDRLGNAVDGDLQALDVRLTMGGEPTFVSIDDMDGAEWNTAALGAEKERRGGQLIRRLRDQIAPKGLLHFGQGKWYPGESLPRWAFTCYWRTDGEALWRDDRWIANPEQDYGYGAEEARRFAEALADRLRVSPEFVVAAYEDPLEYIHKERQLPINVEPEDNRLDDPEERDRLRRVFERGLNTPSGYVLPLQRGYGKDGPEWQSGLWMLRARHLFLVPGDSPVGFRLPLQSLPWESTASIRQVYSIDPFAPRGPLPRAVTQRAVPVGRDETRTRQPVREQGRAVEPGATVRTALAMEARQGRLHVFLPPVESAAEYVELLFAVEDTAARLGTPVLIEGYTPPFDHRLRQIKVTPDPGVLEVNTNPAADWNTLVEDTTRLYATARRCRLGTEKFMLDGRHTGTGGGNHIVMGAAKVADSPFLRRPDLLRSLATFWLNHPSLSYLFSGTFIGPTSQAPRLDETRFDAVYEFEIACGVIDQQRYPAEQLPWLVDRVFRNLFVDVTGNTHRAEFCIDKLYSPDSATGRLGLLEMRAFEMPPHARMSLTQQLLLRALVAAFWRTPYREKPIRWGSRLHDQFLLPAFVEQDFGEVLHFLRRSGYPFDGAWFAPHFEFRFPVYGVVNYQGIEIELRQAIEPWYVLGEEPGAGGTTRYVDSSVERLQVRVRNMVGERHALTCNGRAVPLRPTGTHGEFVAGIRYRAWQPPRCLHPTIGVHTPLRFDLLDRETRLSVGGCLYHVAHPGGRNHETFPVNANEAQGRRAARFFAYSGTPGEVGIPPLEPNPEFPTTLDLRR